MFSELTLTDFQRQQAHLPKGMDELGQSNSHAGTLTATQKHTDKGKNISSEVYVSAYIEKLSLWYLTIL